MRRATRYLAGGGLGVAAYLATGAASQLRDRLALLTRRYDPPPGTPSYQVQRPAHRPLVRTHR